MCTACAYVHFGINCYSNKSYWMHTITLSLIVFLGADILQIRCIQMVIYENDVWIVHCWCSMHTLYIQRKMTFWIHIFYAPHAHIHRWIPNKQETVSVSTIDSCSIWTLVPSASCQQLARAEQKMIIGWNFINIRRMW